MDLRREHVILVADDDEDMRACMSDAVGGLRGCRVIEAADGREALERAIVDTPSVVVLDQGMPLLSGADVVRALHARGLHPTIVLVTGSDAAAIASDVGVDLFLRKPFSLADLEAVVERALAVADRS